MSTDLNDEESFFNTQHAIFKQLQELQDRLNKKSNTKVCLECGEDIGEKRLTAMPSATLCIECATLKDSYKR